MREATCSFEIRCCSPTRRQVPRGTTGMVVQSTRSQEFSIFRIRFLWETLPTAAMVFPTTHLGPFRIFQASVPVTRFSWAAARPIYSERGYARTKREVAERFVLVVPEQLEGFSEPSS